MKSSAYSVSMALGAVIAVTVASSAMVCRGATIEYSHSETDGDVTKPGNWVGGNLPTTADSARFTAWTPEDTGLFLGGDWSMGKLEFYTGNHKIDLKDHKIDFSNCTPGSIEVNWAAAQQYLSNGVITNIASLYLNATSSMELDDVKMYFKDGSAFYNNYGNTLTCKDSLLYIDKIKAGNLGWRNASAEVGYSSSTLTFDNSVMSLGTEASWNTMWFDGGQGCVDVDFLNGSVFENRNHACLGFKGAVGGVHVRFVDSGFYATNTITRGRGFTVTECANSSFAFTNSDFRVFVAYVGSDKHNPNPDSAAYCKEVSNAKFTFHDSRVSARTSLSAAEDSNNAGFYIGTKTSSSSFVFSGENGVADMSNLELYGSDNVLDVCGGRFESMHPVVMGGEGNVFCARNGSVVTSKVVMASGTTGARLLVCDGAAFVGAVDADAKYSPVVFPAGSDNVMIISNGVFESAMVFMSGILNTSGSPGNDAVPFTGCPNSRIEFRGENPKFLVTSNRRWSTDSGLYYSLALGEMIDRSGATPTRTTDAYPLDNPLRIRFCLPADGYAEAPIQVTSGAVVLGGNAEFEFDVTDFKWPQRTKKIPLVYNAAKFRGYADQLYVNVDQLNETNKSRFPSGPNGRTARFELSTDGTTLNLVIPGNSGLTLIFK